MRELRERGEKAGVQPGEPGHQCVLTVLVSCAALAFGPKGNKKAKCSAQPAALHAGLLTIKGNFAHSLSFCK